MHPYCTYLYLNNKTIHVCYFSAFILNEKTHNNPVNNNSVISDGALIDSPVAPSTDPSRKRDTKICKNLRI
jgi:hypothetical protein